MYCINVNYHNINDRELKSESFFLEVMALSDTKNVTIYSASYFIAQL